LKGLLAVVGFVVTTKGIRTGTGTERWKERVPDFRCCDLKLRAPNDADERNREEISVGESEATSGMSRQTCKDERR